jgi:hypothetical protein
MMKTFGYPRDRARPVVGAELPGLIGGLSFAGMWWRQRRQRLA